MIHAVTACGGSSVALDQSRDWLDYLSAFSGLAGALLAAFAIWYASRQSLNAKRDLVRERRAEFELGLLAEIRHQISLTQLQHLAGYVGALIIDAGDETDLPVLRAAIGIKSGPEGRQRRDKLAQDAKASGKDRQSEWLRVATDEVDTAIQRRLGG